MTDRLLDYAFDQLGAADRAETEAALLADPEAAATLHRLRAALRPLEADRAAVIVPPGLVAATLAFVARETVRQREDFRDHQPTPRRPDRAAPREWWLFNRRRLDVAVAAGLGFVAFGLLLSGVSKLRDRSQTLACQERLRSLHVALDGYSDAHGGRYPEVGTPAVPRAGDFAAELVRGGQYDAARAAACPAGATDGFEPATYAYTLGYRPTPFAPVTGVRRAGFASDSGDFTPLVADLPTAAASPVRGAVSPHPRGQNVLFQGGSVRFTTVATVGVRGDDIYRNDAGVVRAGLRSEDATLGRPNDTP